MDCKNPHYLVSNPLYFICLRSSAPCSQTFLISVISWRPETKFHTHTVRQTDCLSDWVTDWLNSLELSPSWEAKSHSVKKFPAFYGTLRPFTVFTKARHCSPSWVRWIQSTPSHPISLRFILSFHLRLGLPSGPYITTNYVIVIYEQTRCNQRFLPVVDVTKRNALYFSKRYKLEGDKVVRLPAGVMKGCFRSPPRPDRLWVLPILLCNW